MFFKFLKNVLKQTWNYFNTKFWLKWKDRERNYQARLNLGLFSHLVVLFLHQICLKGLRVTKTFKEIKFEGVWNELESKKFFRDNNSQNTWEWLEFSSDIAHNGKSLISVFAEFFASINKNFTLTERLATWLSLCQVCTLCWYFLVSIDTKC